LTQSAVLSILVTETRLKCVIYYDRQITTRRLSVSCALPIVVLCNEISHFTPADAEGICSAEDIWCNG
jgi:hypothetical protein